MQRFFEALQEQRWDDHRYYHHSRINQSLHMVSALCFITSYALILTDHPTAAALIGWILAMVIRQAGHFFFEPKGYDEKNQATFEHKEAIKVGYNLHRKQVLLSIWALTPLILVIDPTLFGYFEPQPGVENFMHRTSVLWLWLGGAALLFRVAQLCVQRDALTGFVWLTKILTDPFHDLKLYHKAPLAVLRGELIEPSAAGSGHAAH